jgi:dihydrodipicolinate synthase/N-acetylneuraminate lyase
MYFTGARDALARNLYMAGGVTVATAVVTFAPHGMRELQAAHARTRIADAL